MKSRMIPVLCILLLFLTACQKQTSDDPIVASYKDTQIHESLVAYEKQNQINVLLAKRCIMECIFNRCNCPVHKV